MATTAEPTEIAKPPFATAVMGCGVAAFAIGAIALIGWALGVPGFFTGLPGYVTMKANTALAFMLGGAALAGPSLARGTPSAMRGARLCALVMFAIGALTLVEYATDVDLGLDQLVVREPNPGTGTSHPGRMAPDSALNFVLLGAAFLLRDRSARLDRVVQRLSLVAMFVTLLEVTEYLYHANILIGVVSRTRMALPALVAFFALGAGFVLATSRHGWASEVVAATAGGQVARRLLFALVVVGLLLGWLTLEGYRAGFYNEGFQAAILALATLVGFAVLLGPLVRSLNLADRTRDRALAELTASEAAYRALAEERVVLLEREMRARREAERTNRLKDEFLTTVSHELRTPLNAVLGWASLLLEQTTDPATRHPLEVIRRNALAQAQLVSDLLDVAQAINGRLRMTRGPVEVARVVEAALDAVRPAAAAKKITLETRTDPGTLALEGDADRLQQVIWNLLSNAVKFTPRGGVVGVEIGGDAANIVVRVTDTGSGIPTGFLPFLFDRFTQADSSATRAHGGLGLGLSIARHLVELHGGSIAAANREGARGAVFTVSLPTSAAAAAPEAREPAPVIEARPHDEHARLDGARVLVVDDERDALDLTATILRDNGARPTVVDSARAAFEFVESGSFDALVSDIGMPDESGLEFLARVRLLPSERGGRIPATALSAYARSGDRDRALEAGFDSYVTKPVRPAELVSAIAALLARSRATLRLICP